MLVETGAGTGKAVALEAEFHSAFLAASADVAGFEQFASFGPASLAGRAGQIGQEGLEIGVSGEGRFVEHGFETSGIDVEIAQCLPETVGVTMDVSVGECETFAAVQPAGGDTFQDEFQVGFFHGRLR